MRRAALVLVFISIINIAKGESSLVIFKSRNDKEETIVSTIVVATSGENLTLTCKIVNFNNNHFDNHVVWSKKTNNPRFQAENEQSVSNKLNLHEPWKLNFKPIMLQDDGIYTCKSLKHNLSKVVNLIVQMGSEEYDSKRKRAHASFAKQYLTNIPTVVFPDPMRDLLAKILGVSKDETERAVNLSTSNVGANNWVHNGFNLDTYSDGTDSWSGGRRTNIHYGSSNLGTSSWPSHPYEASITKWASENALENGSAGDELFRKVETTYSHGASDVNNSKTRSEYGVLYFMAAFGGLLLFSVIMCMCIRNNPNLRIRLERPSSLVTVCNIGANPEAETPQMLNQPATHHFFTVVTVDQLRSTTIADAPPSYANSVRQKQLEEEDLPPSYDEAMANMMISTPIVFYSSAPACIGSPPEVSNAHSNVILDAPRGFARFIPSFFVSRR